MSGYTGYAFEFDEEVIGGVTEYNLPLGQEVMSDPVAGSPFASHTSINKQRPRVTLSSFDAAAIFALCVPLGANGGAVFYEQLLNELGVGASGSVHRKHTFADGNLLCRKLSCDHQGDLKCDLEYLPLWDGTDDIMETAGSSALPTFGGDPAHFGLGTVKLGNVVIPKVTKVEIDLGLSADTLGSGGAHWDNEFELSQVKPIITITSRATDLVGGSLPLLGVKGTHANTKIFFRKRSKNLASYVADATAEHLYVTGAGTVYVDDGHKSSGNKRAETVIKMVLDHDGTNNPIVINAATAIS